GQPVVPGVEIEREWVGQGSHEGAVVIEAVPGQKVVAEPWIEHRTCRIVRANLVGLQQRLWRECERSERRIGQVVMRSIPGGLLAISGGVLSRAEEQYPAISQWKNLRNLDLFEHTGRH